MNFTACKTDVSSFEDDDQTYLQLMQTRKISVTLSSYSHQNLGISGVRGDKYERLACFIWKMNFIGCMQIVARGIAYCGLHRRRCAQLVTHTLRPSDQLAATKINIHRYAHTNVNIQAGWRHMLPQEGKSFITICYEALWRQPAWMFTLVWAYLCIFTLGGNGEFKRYTCLCSAMLIFCRTRSNFRGPTKTSIYSKESSKMRPPLLRTLEEPHFFCRLLRSDDTNSMSSSCQRWRRRHFRRRRLAVYVKRFLWKTLFVLTFRYSTSIIRFSLSVQYSTSSHLRNSIM